MRPATIEPSTGHAPGPKRTSRRARVDAELRSLAAEHHGVIDVAEAKRRGIARSSIDRRIAEGALVEVRRGIYRLPGPTFDRQRLAAALLAAGSDAIAIGRSAAYLHGVDKRLLLELAVPPHRSVILPGVHVRRLSIPHDDITRIARLPVTTVLRTCLDLADGHPRRDAERFLDEVLTRRIITIDELRAFASRNSGHPGILALRSLLGERDDGHARLRSQTEALVRMFLREAGLGDGVMNLVVIDADGQERYLDVGWRPPLVGLELHTFRWHADLASWAADAHRANALTAVGWRMVVAPDADLDDRLRRPIAAIRTLLGRS